MNLVDSCGWLEYFADSELADFYSASLNDTENLIVPTICILEVFKKILQQRDESAALRAVAAMRMGVVVDLDTSVALSAGKFGFMHKLPLADSIIYAVAQLTGATILTQDAHFRDLPGVKYQET